MRSSSRTTLEQRALRLSVLDGVLHALMLGVSESYFGACAVALGHADTALAVLVTLPLLAGALAQALTGPLVLLLGSRKRLVVLGAVVQALSHLGLIAIAWLGLPSFYPLLALVTLYFVSGMVIVPAWGAWMGALTEHVDRERYFAVRSACIAFALLVAFVWGGYHLRDGQAAHHLAHAYAWLFAVGFVARTGSSLMLMLQLDPSKPPRDSFLRMLGRTRIALRGPSMKLAFGLALFMFGAHVAIPFYAPFMLKTLALGYDGFALLVAVQLVAKSLVLPFVHRIAGRAGLGRLLVLSLSVLSLVAYLWGSAANMRGLVVAQVLSGAGWAFYEFASFQLLLRGTRPAYRVEFLAIAASLTGFLQLSGALFGSYLLAHAGFDYEKLFRLSAVFRALPLLVLVPLFQQLPTLRAPATLTQFVTGRLTLHPALSRLARRRDDTTP